MPYLLIDKPAGITSHDVVDKIRRITGERTVGHAGTLDPFATGLLIIGVGRESTKHLSTFLGMDKTYEADIVIGATTETLDTESSIIDMSKKDGEPIVLTQEQIESAIESFLGESMQTPPMHSAIKKDGKKMYELARQGKTVEIAARPITIREFKIIDPKWVGERVGIEADPYGLPITIKTRITSSSGTYIRVIARDFGDKLGSGGYLSALRRTAIGPYTVENSRKLQELSPENWVDQAEKDMLLS
jgi:tRNA pseudouridine55 synthase